MYGLLFLVVALIIGFGSPAGWAQSPFDGTWKMNKDSTHFDDAPNVFVLKNGTYRCISCVPKITVRADGTDHKLKREKDYDTLAVAQISDRSLRYTRKKAGRIVSESTDTLSADGNSLISEFKDTPPEGKSTSGSVIFTRISASPKGTQPISGGWRMAKIQGIAEQELSMTLKSTPDGLSMDLPYYGESYQARFDGKEYPVKGEEGGTVLLKKVDDHTILETRRRNGKFLAINEIKVQGSKLTVTAKDNNGKSIMSFTAYKQ